jgi:hypothetical protein
MKSGNEWDVSDLQVISETDRPGLSLSEKIRVGGL